MKKKIMIVDDAIFMRTMIANILYKNGYNNIMQACDGKECIEKYPSYQPDIVFLDITMPDKNGIEVAKELFDLDANANIIMCSAMGQESMITTALRIGVKDFIIKPFKENQIIQVIETLRDI